MDSPTAQPGVIDPHPLREMLAIAAPTVATMTSYTLMQFVDAMMVSRIDPPSPDYLAGQGNGAVWAFAPISILAGFLSVINTYVSQHLGAKTPQRAPAYAWNGLWLSLFSALALIPYALLLPHLFAAGWMNHSPRVVQYETQFAQILLFGALPGMCTRTLAQFFFGMHRPVIVLIAAVCGNLTNFLVNLVLIFGHKGWGIPAFGVPGAACGTVIGSMVECAIPMCVFLSAKYNLLYRTRSAWRLSWAHIRDITRIGWPPALMYGNEIVCWAVFMTALAGRFGPEHNTAGWIALRYMHLSFMPAVGISVAMTAIVGKCIGARRPDLVPQRVRMGLWVTMTYMSLCGLVFVLFRHDLVHVFIKADTPPDQAARVIEVGGRIMIIAAIFQAFDGMGMTLVGSLRGAGDTIWPGVATIILAWSCIIGVGGAFAIWWPDLGSVGPWIGAGLYIILLGVALMWRYLSGKWRTMEVLEHAAGGH